MCGSEGDDGDGRHDEEKEREGGLVEGTLEKERRLAAGSWLAGEGGGGRSKRAVLHPRR